MSGESGPENAGTIPYRRPDRAIVDIVEAPPTPLVVLAPGGDRMLFGEYDALPPIEQQAEPILGLAGIRFRPRLNESNRAYYFKGLELLDIASGDKTRLDVPKPSRLGRPLFSTNGKHVAFTNTVEEGVELWVADVDSGASRRLLGPILNDVLGGAFAWLGERSEMLVSLVPSGRGDPPAAPRVPTGPVVEDTAGKRATNRTFQDLLKNGHDEALFEHYVTAQLARVDLAGNVTKLGAPAIFLDASPSPDASSMLIERVIRPYSYAVPIARFAHVVEIWDLDGNTRAELGRLPLVEEVPIQGVPKGPRSTHWIPTLDASLCFAIALDDGDPKRSAEHRDELFRIDAPYHGGFESARSLGKTKERFVGIEWLDRPAWNLVTEWDRDRRWITTTLRDASDPARAPKVIFDRSQNDHYGDPGELVYRRTRRNQLVARLDGDAVFLSGAGATEEGDRPFLDRLDLVTLEKSRWFQSGVDRHASFVQFASCGATPYSMMIVRAESRTEPPNFHLVEVTSSPGSRPARALTSFPDPHPQLTGIEKQLLRYRREDGVELSGTLYVPPSRKDGERVPLVIWAYPLEYNDASTAGQVSAAPNRFTRLSGTSPLFFLLSGCAVLDEATIPIVGDPEKVNDTFVAQCVSSAKAAIDAVVDLGVADRERVAVGGHSYGAFMTATLLAHSTLFKAGIARSGAYNRTLTPFGFQGERRTLWEARDTYLAMSPLLHADTLKTPILLIHGEIDENPGTHTFQSKRLFHALAGLGATARLVLLPHESHGYVAKESVLHVLAESFDWIDRFVRSRPSAN